MENKANTLSLSFNDKNVILIGTAHVSEESARQVARVIEEERPDTVCIELCKSRYDAMTKKDQWRETDLIKVIKEKKVFLLFSNLLLSSFQKRIGKKLGVRPGEEVLTAINCANSVGARIHLADRDIRVTLSRTWRLMGLKSKFKLLAQLLGSASELDDIKEQDIEKMKDTDVLEGILSEIGETLPAVRQVLIDERDQYLAHKIRSAPGKKIVAVVGAGHVPGIQANWERPIDIKALETIPPKGKTVSILKWSLPTLIIGLMIAGFFIGGKTGGTQMVKWWFLANGFFSGLGAVLALAHPLTILSAIIAAPITSLNPMIAAGWVAGMVEVFMGKPKVKDFEALPLDITSAKGFWRNRITRILLVVILTNLGSAVGTFIAIPFMLKVFT